jgi:hypothetical protein
MRMEQNSSDRDPEPEAGGAPAPPPLSRTQRREKAAADALRTFVRDLYTDRFGRTVTGPEPLALDLRLTARPADGWALDFDPPLSDQVLRQLEDAEAGRGAFQPGGVYCFRCESAVCAHARPPSLQAVFRAYTSMGTPEWQPLHQALVEVRDERVDQLFRDPPRVVTLRQFGHDLRLRQLSSFGRSSKTYAILGQIIAGYFVLPRTHGGSDTARRLALTFQVAEARARAGQVELRLNTVSALRPEDLEDLLVSDWEPWVHRARELAVRAIEALERQVRAARETGRTEAVRDLMRRVPVILRRLSESLERGYRQEQRRTRHVEDRRHEHRPVHKALDDLGEAPPDAIFWDERGDTLVVRGPQGRAHVFSPSGRHVTSFVLKPEAVDWRLRTRRWRAASPEEIRELRGKVSAASVAPPAL